MLLTEFQRLVEEALPPHAAVQGDAIGLQVESQRQTAHRVLVALELTDEVLVEAEKSACDVVLVFHPLIYRPLAKIDHHDRVGRLVAGLIRSDIALIAVHTSFDALPQGTNAILAEKLGLTVQRTLSPNVDGSFGMGVLATSESPLSIEDLTAKVSAVCGGPLRYGESPAEKITDVAIVAGSGMSYYSEAVESKAQVFITADVKYHDFHAAQNVIGIIDPGHFEMERFVPEGIVSLLRTTHSGIPEMLVSTVDTNPVRYASASPLDHSLQQVG